MKRRVQILVLSTALLSAVGACQQDASDDRSTVAEAVARAIEDSGLGPAEGIYIREAVYEDVLALQEESPSPTLSSADRQELTSAFRESNVIFFSDHMSVMDANGKIDIRGIVVMIGPIRTLSSGQSIIQIGLVTGDGADPPVVLAYQVDADDGRIIERVPMQVIED